MPDPDGEAPHQVGHIEELEQPRKPRDTVTLLTIVAGSIGTQLLFTVNGVLTARMLGVEGRGQLLLVSALAAMASQMTLGGALPNAVTKLLAERGATARDGLAHLVPSWLAVSIIPSVLAASYLLYLQRDALDGTTYALAIALVVMAIQTMGLRILIGAMLGEGIPVLSIALVNLAPQVLVTTAMVVAFSLGARLTVIEILSVSIGSALLTSVVRLFALRKPTRDPEERIPARVVWDLSRKTYIGSVGPIDGLSIDRILIGSLMGNVQLGLYSAAFALVGLTTIVGGCIAMILLPRLATAQSDAAVEKDLVRRWILIATTLILGCVLVLELLAEPVIRIAFGQEFVGATECSYWLIAAGGFLSFRRVLIAILQARTRGAWASWIEIALTPFVVLGIWLSSRTDSLVVAGMAMAAIGVISCLALGVAVRRSGPGRSRSGPGDRQPVDAATG